VDRRGGKRNRPRYPRVARVNEVLREVVAGEIERLSDHDERLQLVTVTAVESEPDLRHATVFLSSLSEDAREGLEQQRVRLQAAIGRQVRLKRTPLLAFSPDPGVAEGERVESILRRLDHPDPGADAER
ncbi:MAG TPA: ribosome-binding factor A, partial [Acidimicrobiales bacterium]|nr:ribosome-binding factor A [Acidimicrobiales bacterium]